MKKECINNLKCPICGTLFYRKQSYLNKHKNICCSRKCRGEFLKELYKGENNPFSGRKLSYPLGYKVYVLYSTEDFRIKYVGATKDVNNRFHHHLSTSELSESRKCKWIRNLLYNGYELRYKIVHHCKDMKEALSKEVNLIRILKELGYELVNSTDGGLGCKNPTEDIRKKKSEFMSSREISFETREKMRASKIGKQSNSRGRRSDDFREKMSHIMKGKPSNNRKSILEFSMDGNLIRKYHSIKDAAIANNCSISTISNCLTGRSKTANKKKYIYEN